MVPSIGGANKFKGWQLRSGRRAHQRPSRGLPGKPSDVTAARLASKMSMTSCHTELPAVRARRRAPDDHLAATARSTADMAHSAKTRPAGETGDERNEGDHKEEPARVEAQRSSERVPLPTGHGGLENLVGILVRHQPHGAFREAPQPAKRRG